MQSDKQSQFIEYYENYKNESSSYCRALMRDEDNAKDLMSETILAAFEKLHTLREPEKFKFYIFGIASRLFRKKLRRQRILQFTGLEQAKETGSTEQTDEKAALNMLYKCISKLKPTEAEALVMHEISGFTFAEVAEILNTNVSTIKSQVYRSREKLEIMLQNDRQVLLQSDSNPLIQPKTAIS